MSASNDALATVFSHALKTTPDADVITLGRIRGLEFDRAARVLIVTFDGGRRFRFTSIDPELFDALSNRETRDRVFALRIADHFPWVEQPTLS